MPKLTKRTVDAIEPQAIPAKTEPRTSPYRDDRQKWRRYGAARASLVREMLAIPLLLQNPKFLMSYDAKIV